MKKLILCFNFEVCCFRLFCAFFLHSTCALKSIETILYNRTDTQVRHTAYTANKKKKLLQDATNYSLFINK